MTPVASAPLDDVWKRRFDLNGRGAPELYELPDVVGGTPHAGAIRATLDGLGASAVFCVQGIPTIVILKSERYELDTISRLHAALWNQGLASLLLVLTGDTVRAFSLSRMPCADPGDEFERRCLVATLDATADALALKDMVYGAESGRFWEDHAELFKPQERVDQFLLENLTSSHKLLCDAGLSQDGAQALLMQAMFIAYLEDREIIGKDCFRAASNSCVEDFSALLRSGKVSFLHNLFAMLRDDFNGDLFVTPCAFDAERNPPRIRRDHLDVLARFREGREHIPGGQLRFWGYDFRHIPIELLSSVYDRFLGDREADRHEHGAYYTPMFLVDCVVSQAWETLSPGAREEGEFLDPACGSGIFLVRAFQRLCEDWRERHNAQTIRWDSLRKILLRLHGRDVNGGAVRVAVFSLYIALLEQVDSPGIRQLVSKGRVLPMLWNHTFRCQDFFAIPPDEIRADVVIGNPPWASRRGPARSSAQWCETHGLPMPAYEDAWAFAWKSMMHLRREGVVAFLLPAMAFLHNHANTSIAARRRLLETSRIKRIVNFADLRFQLFDGATRPAALIIFGKAGAERSAYRFEYWVPKADLNLGVRRMITLSSVDRCFLTSQAAVADPLLFKRRLWMSEPDARLFKYLEIFPKLGNRITDYGSHGRMAVSTPGGWMIGQGFKPDDPSSRSGSQRSAYVGALPHLPIGEFRPLALSAGNLTPWRSSYVYRKGFERGFEGARILIPQGVGISDMRLRAAYTEDAFTFQHSLQAISVPRGEETRAKLVTALLNSRIAIWYAFHGTSSFGSDRPKVHQAELLNLPFPEPCDLGEPKRARKAAGALVSIIDKVVGSSRPRFTLASEDSGIFEEIDALAYEYFCLSPREIAVIEDGVRFIFPAVQPHRGGFPEIWKSPTEADRRLYAETLTGALEPWFHDGRIVNVRLESYNADVAILRLTLCRRGERETYKEAASCDVRRELGRLFELIHKPLPGNFQLVPDLRIFQAEDLYFVKPMQRRFWLRTAAFADASAVVNDLHDYAGSSIGGVALDRG